MRPISLRIILLLMIFALRYHCSAAINIYIPFDPKNCINCSAGLYSLCREPSVQQLTLILKEEYRADEQDLNETYEFNKFPKIKLVYSDSLYRTWSHTDNAIDLVIADDGNKEIYRSDLRRLNMQKIRTVCAGQKVAGDTVLCYSSFGRKMLGFNVAYPYVFSLGMHSRSAVNISQQTELPVKITDTLSITLYKNLYKQQFDKKYPFVKSMIEGTPVYKPQVSGQGKWDDNSIFVLCSVKDFRSKHGSGDTDSMEIFSIPVITRFYPSSGVWTIYNVDKSLPADFNIWDVYKESGRFYVQGVYNDDRYGIYELTCNDDSKTFSLNKKLPIGQPSDYKKRGVSPLEEYNTCVNGNLLAFIYDDKITRLDNENQVKIPFGQKGSDAWNAYEIRDLQEDDLYYHVLYIHDGNHHALRFSKDGKTKQDIIIGSTSNIQTTKIKFYMNGNTLLCKPNSNEDCLRITTIPMK
ncbi:MAG: hypothetical protein JST70_03250 [Bacteroidetes bacterium]|nr:hypothetical protein [Bacteroidota bacterium]